MVLLLDQFSAVCAIWEEFTKQNQYQSISLSQITFVSKGLNHINIKIYFDKHLGLILLFYFTLILIGLKYISQMTFVAKGLNDLSR